MNITEVMSELVLQIGIIIFAVRAFGGLAKKIGIPPVLGELLAGVVIGPYALGGIAFPGFPHGIFPLGSGSLAVGAELYGFATVASIILLFVSGLETDLALFLRYSVAGGIIGLGGVVFSFVLGDLAGVFLLKAPFMDPRCLFMGILSTATSVGITARILSDQKKMDSPEGVTILAAAVFDDVLGIIMLAVVLGIVAVVSGGQESLNAVGILAIAAKALGIWLGVTILALIFARRLAAFLKLFKAGFDFAILALGIALLLAGLFEKQGLAMIIGAYIAGLAISKTDIAPVVQERIHGLYEFFVPLFFAVMGMMVNVRDIISGRVLVFGAVYTVTAVLAKIAGCGGPALLLGFNRRGALRIGAGMVPRGEVALIIAGIALSSGVLDGSLFAVIIVMTFATTLAAPPLLNFFLRSPGSGTRKPVKGDDSAQAVWKFSSDEIADIVGDSLLKALRSEGFYVQRMNVGGDICQARKDDIILSITEGDRRLTIEAAREDMPFAKTAVYEAILELSEAVQKLKDSADPAALKKELLDEDGRAGDNMLSLITPECVSLSLKGTTKEEVITALVDMLASQEKLEDRDAALEDVFQRERVMSTAMQHGIALPHAKTSGVEELCVAVGIKPEGVDAGSLDGEPSRLFILVLSPKHTSGPHVQFLAAIGAVLQDEAVREEVIRADSPEEAAALLRKKH